MPDTIVLVFYMVLTAAALTWVVPSGEYVREWVETDGRMKEVVVDGSFHYVERAPQLFGVFFALFKGFVDKADVIVFVLMVGGAFWILNGTGAIDRGIKAFVARLRRKQRSQTGRWSVDDTVLTLIMVVFSLFGAVFGMSEETLAFILIFVPMAISMGYDSIVGVCISYLAAHVGFAGAMLNPFTVGVAQGLAGLPLFSGVEYRFVCWLVLTAVAVVFVLAYARRLRKDPTFSPMYKLDDFWRRSGKVADPITGEPTGQAVVASDTVVASVADAVDAAQAESAGGKASAVRARHIVFAVLAAAQVVMACLYPMASFDLFGRTFALPLLPCLAGLFVLAGGYAARRSGAAFSMGLLLFTILYLVSGVLCFGWYMTEIAGLFFAMGLAAGLASGWGMNPLMRRFMEGVKDMLGPAMIIGMASGIIFILQEGKIIDTLLYSVSYAMSEVGEVASLAGMYLFQTMLNVVMPSGSAKAALTMPIMAPLSDLMHISRQTTVLAFQFGDGFTNMITPTSGILMGVLGAARIPYAVWLKWVYKFILFCIGLGFLLLLPTLYFTFNGF